MSKNYKRTYIHIHPADTTDSVWRWRRKRRRRTKRDILNRFFLGNIRRKKGNPAFTHTSASSRKTEGAEVYFREAKVDEQVIEDISEFINN